MADRNLDITFRIINASKGFAADQKAKLRELVQETNKAANAQSNAAKNTAKQQIISLQSVALAGIKYQDQRTKADAKAAAESSKAWTKSGNDQLREFNRVNKETERERKKKENDEKRAANESTRAWNRANNELMRDFRRVTSERSRAAKEIARVEKENERITRSNAKAWKDFRSEFSGMSDMTKSVAGLAAGYLSLSGAGMALDYLNTYLEAGNKTIKDAIASTMQYRDSLLEVANLKGNIGNTTKETKDQLIYRAATLQSKEDAIEYQKGYLNTAQAGVASKAIDQIESDKLMVLGGQYQAAAGGSADTQGNLLGALPAIMAAGGKGPTDAAKTFGKFGQIRDIISMGGSDEGSGFAQLLQNASYSKIGLYKDIADQAALQSMFSTSSPQGAGTLVDQFTRGTVGGLGKMRGQGVEGGEKLGAYLKGLGATESMGPIEIGKLISKDLSEQKVKFEEYKDDKGVKHFNDYGYLSRHGYTEQETRDAILQFHSSNTGGTLDAFLDKARAPTSSDALEQKFKNFKATDPVARERQVKLSEDAGKFTTAAGPNEYYNQIKRQAFNALQQENPTKYTGSFDDWDMSGSKNAWFKRDIINKADEMIRGEANKVGVYIPQTGDTYSQNGEVFENVNNPLNYSFKEADFMQSDADQAKEYFKYGSEIAAKGGNAIPGVDKMIGVMERVVGAVEKVDSSIKARIAPIKGPKLKPQNGNVGMAAP